MRLFIILLFFIATYTAKSQNNRVECNCGSGGTPTYTPNYIYENIWKVDEMYISDIPVKDSIAYQLRFMFFADNDL